VSALLEIDRDLSDTSRNKAMIASLREIVKDSSPEPVAWAAIPLLSGMSSKVPDSITILIEALKHESNRVRGKAAQALGKIGPSTQEVISALEAASRDSYSNVREAASEALLKIQFNNS
jgi:HEAT repeat protein